MSSTPENPFSNYRAPELDQLFSASGIVQILEFKKKVFANKVKDQLLEEGNLEKLLQEGSDPYEVVYTLNSPDALMQFPSIEAELYTMAAVAGRGIVLAGRARGIDLSKHRSWHIAFRHPYEGENVLDDELSVIFCIEHRGVGETTSGED